ncbi:MAG: MBL fold metallo-hydrolase [Chlorobi bacterium]|nr:MBL fold metallo-hydrolase [Chlorobiota bacterium]
MMNQSMNHFLKSRYDIELPVELYLFKSSYCNIYLLETGGKGLLVDAGKEGKEQAFLDFLAQVNLEPKTLKYIVLTHTHNDHTGALRGIAEATGAKIAVHANEADNLREGYTRAPLGTGLFTKTISFIGRKVAPSNLRYPPVEPDIILGKEQQEDFEHWHIEWFHTPGHTDGSVTYITDGKVALPGDDIFGIRRNDSMPWFANDLNALKKSWELLLDSGAQIFLPAHGKPVTREILEQSYRKLAG